MTMYLTEEMSIETQKALVVRKETEVRARLIRSDDPANDFEYCSVKFVMGGQEYGFATKLTAKERCEGDADLITRTFLELWMLAGRTIIREA